MYRPRGTFTPCTSCKCGLLDSGRRCAFLRCLCHSCPPFPRVLTVAHCVCGCADFLPKERDPYCRAARLLALVPPSAMSASIDALPLPPPPPPPSSVSVERGGAGEAQEELRVHKAAKERRQLTIHCDLNAVRP